jgi:hypothetical protein
MWLSSTQTCAAAYSLPFLLLPLLNCRCSCIAVFQAVLDKGTASLAQDSQIACIFVNDECNAKVGHLTHCDCQHAMHGNEMLSICYVCACQAFVLLHIPCLHDAWMQTNAFGIHRCLARHSGCCWFTTFVL